MTFGKGELAFGRSFDPATGRHRILFSFPEGWTLSDTMSRIAPDLDLSEFEETSRQARGRSFLSQITGEERREIVVFERKDS